MESRLWRCLLRLLGATRKRGLIARIPVYSVVSVFALSMFGAWATSYVYDANGRLTVVTNDSGQSARYRYDAMGNILEVTRFQVSDLAIFGFSPEQGAPGTQVTITGQQFSATAGSNLVTFNGTAASVVSASASTIVALVPAGATTGEIGVTVGAGVAMSADDFVVDASHTQPIISTVSPLIARPGDLITVTGSNMVPSPNQTSIKVGGVVVQPLASSNASITFNLPTGVGSGHVSVTTPFGIAISADSILVLPADVDPGKIDGVISLEVGDPAQALSVSAAQKIAAATFEGEGGEWLSVQFASITSSYITYAFYDPTNRSIGSGTISPSSPTIHLPKIARKGEHLLLLTPSTGPASWTIQLEPSAALGVSGASVALNTAQAGQSKRLLFEAEAGKNLGLGLFDRTPAESWHSATATVLGPDGSQLAQQLCAKANAGCGLNFTTLASGTHSIIMVPSTTTPSSIAFDAILSDDITASLTLETQYSLNINKRGQNARLSFAGQEGQSLALKVSDQSSVPVDHSAYYRIQTPDGKLWKTLQVSTGALLSFVLPTSGTYQVMVDPAYGETIQAKVTLTAGQTSSMQLDGADGAFSTSLPGEGVYFNFVVAGEQNLGLGISDLVISNGTAANVTVIRPDGTVLGSQRCAASNAGCDFNLAVTAAGKYAVEVTPVDAQQTMSFKSTLSTDVTGSLLRDTPSGLSITRRGQNARLSFSGVAGDTVALQLTGQITTPASGRVYYRVSKPDGTSLTSSIATEDRTINMVLPIAGEYQILVDPEFGAKLTTTLEMVAGQLGEMELDGSEGLFQTTVAGQDIAITVPATVGKGMSLALSDIVVSTSDRVSVKAYTPTGAVHQSSTNCLISNGGCDIEFFKPVSGNYSVIISPASAAQTMKFRATLSSDLEARLERDVPFNLALDRRGQNGWLSFDGATGETVALQIANQQTAPVGKQTRYLVFRPTDTGDTSWKSNTAVVSGGDLNLSLPQTGTYRVFVDPDYGAAANAQLTVTSGQRNGLSIDGEAIDVGTSLPGETLYFKVDATTGQNISAAISTLSVSEGTYVNVAAYEPDGDTYLSETRCFVSEGGCDVDIFRPVTGSYMVVVRPAAATQVMQFKMTLSSDVIGVLPRDTATELNLSRPGQNGWLSFNGTAGESLAIQAANQQTSPEGTEVRYLVFRPSDTGSTSWKSMTGILSGGVLNLSLPTTGTYMLFVDPDHGAAASTQLTLSTGTATGLEPGGAPVSVETGFPGQTVYFSVPTVEGQNRSFSVSNLVVSSGTYVEITAYEPDGDVHLSTTRCQVSDGGCDVDFVKPGTGTYKVAISPQTGDQAMQFDALISSDVTGVLQRDVPLTLNLARRGQNGWLSFTGTAGESLAVQAANQQTFPANREVRYLVFRSTDGNTSWKSMTGILDGGVLNLSLPATGTYMLYVDPDYGATTSTQLTLSTGTASGLEPDGAPVNVETDLPGQTAYFSVPTVAGQNRSFSVSDLVVSSGTYVDFTAYEPDGDVHLSTRCYVSNGGCDVDFFKPVTGAYKVSVSPSSGSQSMQFSALISSDVTGSLQKDVPLNLNLTRHGQNGWLSFAGTAGEQLALKVTGQQTSPVGLEARYLVFRSTDGTSSWKAMTGVVGAGTLSLSLPVTGTYMVWVDPDYGAGMQSIVTLSSGLTSGMVLDGASAQVPQTFAGEGIHISFTAQAGQNLGLGISDIAVSTGSSISVRAVKPNGDDYSSNTCPVSELTCGLNLSNLDAGNYSIIVTPSSNAQKMAFKATLSTDVVGTLQRGVKLPISLTRLGQNGWWSFQGTAAESLTLKIENQVSDPVGGKVYYGVIRSNGSTWKSVTTLGGNLAMANLPETGTYKIFVTPDRGQKAEAEITVTSP